MFCCRFSVGQGAQLLLVVYAGVLCTEVRCVGRQLDGSANLVQDLYMSGGGHVAVAEKGVLERLVQRLLWGEVLSPTVTEHVFTCMARRPFPTSPVMTQRMYAKVRDGAESVETAIVLSSV